MEFLFLEIEEVEGKGKALKTSLSCSVLFCFLRITGKTFVALVVMSQKDKCLILENNEKDFLGIQKLR